MYGIQIYSVRELRKVWGCFYGFISIKALQFLYFHCFEVLSYKIKS